VAFVKQTKNVKTSRAFLRWFDLFLGEKNLSSVHWTLVDEAGFAHFIGSENVIEAIKLAPFHEQTEIRRMLEKIDFLNGDVNAFFRHLAGALINRREDA
jgi:hypothetical protein